MTRADRQKGHSMKKRHVFALACALLVAAGAGVAGRLRAGDDATPFVGEPEIIAATFSSAWCAACAVLEPKLARVTPAFASAPVAFVKFDFSFGPRDETREAAERFGLEGLYERNKGATGFTVLVDADTGEIVDTLTMNFSEAAMKSAIARALALAAYTDKAPEAAAPAN